MHGVRRNARDYRDQWHELAKRHDFLLLVPEFSERDFPGTEGYNLGRQFDQAGRPVPRDQWSWSAIEPLFDEALKRFGMVTNSTCGGPLKWMPHSVLSNPRQRPARPG